MQLIQHFQGTQLRPGDDGYDEARTLFNGMIDRRPALIAQCTDADDVARRARRGAGARGCASPCARAATPSPGCRSSTTASSSTCAR